MKLDEQMIRAMANPDKPNDKATFIYNPREAMQYLNMIDAYCLHGLYEISMVSGLNSLDKEIEAKVSKNESIYSLGLKYASNPDTVK